jgi:hypothetical protein
MDGEATEASLESIHYSGLVLLDLNQLTDNNQLAILLSVIENGRVDFEHAYFVYFNLRKEVRTFSADFMMNVLER